MDYKLYMFSYLDAFRKEIYCSKAFSIRKGSWYLVDVVGMQAAAVDYCGRWGRSWGSELSDRLADGVAETTSRGRGEKSYFSVAVIEARHV